MTKFIFSLVISATIAVTGISLIAQEARPGDLLYGFKTAVNERVTGLFAVTYTAQVDHEVDILEERLAEIDALVVSGEMTPEAALEAKAGVVAQLEKTSAIFDKAKGMNLDAAAKARISASLSRLQVALKTYRDSLNSLDEVVAIEESRQSTRKRSGGSTSSISDTITETIEEIEEEVSETIGEEVVETNEEEVTEDTATTTATSTDEVISEETDEGIDDSGETAEEDTDAVSEPGVINKEEVDMSTSSESDSDQELDVEAEAEMESENANNSSQSF